MKLRHSLTAALAAGLLSLAPDAFAVVGRPLTPVSVAGVARRTTRRTVAVGAAAVTATAVTAAALTTLPSGCAQVSQTGATYYRCGSIYYQPVYQSGNLVYVEATP